MKKFYKNYLQSNLFFWLFSIAGLLLIIASFLLPPMGIVDNSILAAVGELDGVIALGTVIKSIDKGRSASFQHNGTSVTITNKDEEGEDGDK